MAGERREYRLESTALLPLGRTPADMITVVADPAMPPGFARMVSGHSSAVFPLEPLRIRWPARLVVSHAGEGQECGR